jgi:hypothetical protein
MAAQARRGRRPGACLENLLSIENPLERYAQKQFHCEGNLWYRNINPLGIQRQVKNDNFIRETGTEEK